MVTIGKSRTQRRNDNENGRHATQRAQEYVSSDIGAREPSGLTFKVMVSVAVLWSLFQIWIASPLPYIVAEAIPDIGVLNSTQVRSIHLAFAVFLAYLLYPALPRSPRDRVPIIDWIFAIAGALAAGYLYLFYHELTLRPGMPNLQDGIVAAVGMITLLEATRRTLGPPLMIVALVFLAYVFFGQYAPGILAWAGASFDRTISHMWLTTEGVFGVALGVSASFVFLFVLFGALLEHAGAGNYFIKIAFALLGHLRGGPAKAAVLSSGLTGLISGSSIANVVTTGTFTIPLMKRVGYPAYKAGAIESAASVNGQIMPPVMGAAAFLMVEYVGIPYLQVLKHAFLPAIITYIALFYIVHLEAVKADMLVLPRRRAPRPLLVALLRAGIIIASVLIIAGAAYYAVSGIRMLFGDVAFWIIVLLLCVIYVGLVAYAARVPPLEQDNPDAPITELPALGPTVKSGLYFTLPIFVLVWALMVERLSASVSAFYAVVCLVFILITQPPLLALFRQQGQIGAATQRGVVDLFGALFWGARNMIGVAIACAAAGFVVGAVTLTGVGQVLTQFIAVLSGGSLILMLALVAVTCLILGMGLPTTANYIVVSSLMAPVVVELSAQNGLAIPLIGVHMFVFYFGLMADVTPPVGLASYAAAAVARDDPIRTGLQAFAYESRTALLPFMFIFNTKLLLIGLDGPLDTALTVAGALAGMLLFCAATQRWFVTRTRLWESAILLLVAFTFIRPGFWLNQIEPEYQSVPFVEVSETIPELPAGALLRLHVQGVSIEGKQVSKTVILPLGAKNATAERLRNAGLIVAEKEGGWRVQRVVYGSPARSSGVRRGFEVTSAQVENDRVSEYWFYIPALLVLASIILIQRRRKVTGQSASRSVSVSQV